MPQMQNPADSGRRRLIQVMALRGGGGHYATYVALRAVIEQQQRSWDLEVSFMDELGNVAPEPAKVHSLYAALGASSDQFYDWIQKRGLAWIHLLTIHLHKLLTWLKHAVDVRLLEQIWRQRQPDLVLSVVPFHNRAIWESMQRVNSQIPVVTLLTDFADCPPAYWIEPTTQNYWLCGTDKAVEQARHRGIAPNRIIQTSGLVIHSRFYRPIERDRRIERQRLGLDPDRLTGLVLFGANGSRCMIEIAQQLESLHDQLQLIFLCGRNVPVAAALRQLPGRQTRLILAFTPDIPDYMHLADFMIGKPGNVSVTEAIAMGLPVIVERNALTLPQERYAADWIKAQEVGLTISSFRQIRAAVTALIEPETFNRYRANAAAINNQAVFEVPDILERLLTQHHRSDSPEPPRLPELREQTR